MTRDLLQSLVDEKTLEYNRAVEESLRAEQLALQYQAEALRLKGVSQGILLILEPLKKVISDDDDLAVESQGF